MKKREKVKQIAKTGAKRLGIATAAVGALGATTGLGIHAISEKLPGPIQDIKDSRLGNLGKSLYEFGTDVKKNTGEMFNTQVGKIKDMGTKGHEMVRDVFTDPRSHMGKIILGTTAATAATAAAVIDYRRKKHIKHLETHLKKQYKKKHHYK